MISLPKTPQKPNERNKHALPSLFHFILMYIYCRIIKIKIVLMDDAVFMSIVWISFFSFILMFALKSSRKTTMMKTMEQEEAMIKKIEFLNWPLGVPYWCFYNSAMIWINSLEFTLWLRGFDNKSSSNLRFYDRRPQFYKESIKFIKNQRSAKVNKFP